MRRKAELRAVKLQQKECSLLELEMTYRFMRNMASRKALVKPSSSRCIFKLADIGFDAKRAVLRAILMPI